MSIDNRESKIEKYIRKITDTYLNSPEIRNPILQIHILGPAIEFVMTTLSQDLYKKRFLQTIQTMHEQIIYVSEEKVDRSYLRGQEFHDNLRRLIDYALGTKDAEKIRWYCRILIGSTLLENVNERRSAEDFLIFLSELTTTDILVGKEIYELQKNVPETLDISSDKTELKYVVEEAKWHEIKGKLGLDDVEFKISLIKLSRVGLIKEIVGMYVGYTGGLYLITPVFKRLMKLIQYANEPTFNYKLTEPS